MNAITSAAAFFRASAGKQVRKSVAGVATIEDWPRNVELARIQLAAQGCPESDIKEDDKGLTWPGGFLMKPKFRKEETGTLQVRSADYGFQSEHYPKPVWGDKKGSTIEDGKLVKRYDHGLVVTFEILD